MSKLNKTIFIILVAVLISLGIYLIGSPAEAPETPTDSQLEKVSLFFGQEGTEEILPVSIEIEKGDEIEKRTLEELLMGAPDHNLSRNLSSQINPGVKIQSFRIENKVAYVDFSKELEEGVAGSARVLAIREQIEKTLTQFSTINEVIISIDGRTGDILQP